MLTVKDRVKQTKLKHAHNVFNNVGPSYLFNNFRRMNERSIQTRQSEYNFFVPRVQGIATNSFFYTSIMAWNSIPNSIKCLESKPRFIKAITKYLREQEQNVENNDFLYY